MRVQRNVLVELSDGATLAADLYLPDGPGPFPTLASFYPYRKDDVIGSGFEHPRRRLVEHGYAHLLVDVRGYGGSGGCSVDSMHPRPEGVDAAEVVRWAASQPWSTGDVGVWGVSYGGLVSFAVAAEAPPALRAIATVYGFDDIHRDAIAPGGVPLALGRYAREAVMLAQELAPPTFQDPDGRWSAVWRERLALLEPRGPWSLAWPEREGDEAFWRERTIELDRVRVPALVIAGWRDLFAEPESHALERVPGCRHLVLGPWMHVVPDLELEPFDWIDELRRFFDRHVRGIDPGGEEPRGVTFFVQGEGGGWRRAAAWPPPGGDRRTLHPAPGGVLGDDPADGEDRHEAVATIGVGAGLLDPLGTGAGRPGDQGADDRRSLAYTTAPLDAELIVAGSPEAVLDVAVDGDGPAELTAKLVDVAPDGAAELITTGWARLDASGIATVTLAATAYRLPAGHALRLSVAGADFPRMWPLPHPVRFALRLSGCALRVPTLPPGAEVEAVEVPRPAPVADRAPWTVEGAPAWRVCRDEIARSTSVTYGGGERMRAPSGTDFSISHRSTATVADDRPDGARVEAQARIEARLPAGEHVEVDVRLLAHRDRQHYRGRVTMDGQVVLDRDWGAA